MKNCYGETVKPRYEVVLEARVDGSAYDDFESVDFMSADTYREAVKSAKQWSLNYPDTTKHRVQITCYYEDDVTSYNQVWFEYYEHGAKEGRYEA